MNARRKPLQGRRIRLEEGPHVLDSLVGDLVAERVDGFLERDEVKIERRPRDSGFLDHVLDTWRLVLLATCIAGQNGVKKPLPHRLTPFPAHANSPVVRDWN